MIRTFALLFSMVVANISAAQVATVELGPTELNTEPTALDKYVAAEDDAYKWEIISTRETKTSTTYVVDLKSQRWLTEKEVDRTLWQHWLTICVPKTANSNKAMMFIGGGSNGGEPPKGADIRIHMVAMSTNSVVAELTMIPNQALVFHGDGVPRKEDDLIAYTWAQYIKTGDDRWPARLPMVKSVVRAMDTVEKISAKNDAIPSIDQFVVAGGSKRGWTTWMTAAVDKRVVAIAPIVIDVLNTNLSMAHHYSAYGFWAPAIGDYVHHKIMDHRYEPRAAELFKLVDPYAYRDRFTMPKCIINATGDQFFLPDSSQFYYDDLPGEKHLCYVPNAGHSLDGSNALDTLISFQHSIVNDVPRPEFVWEFPDATTIRVETKSKPTRVLLWQATNEKTRDFRIDQIGKAYKSTELSARGGRFFTGKVQEPKKGWTAYFIQLEFDVGAAKPMRLSTPVRVIPDELPFAGKRPPSSKQAASE